MGLDALRARSLADEAALAPPDEVPAEFFASWLGPRMKYSCGLWSEARDLAAADEAMLELLCERAGVEDGMRILDLGAGWGALTFWILERYPRAQVCALTRSMAQERFILDRAARKKQGVRVLLGDARTIEPVAGHDRVFAIEMIEHVGKPEAMLRRASAWLARGGRLFVQSIAHRDRASAHELPWFEDGVMLSDPLIDAFETGLTTEERWTIDGAHYSKTIEAWRARLLAHRREAAAALGSLRRYRRWCAFLLLCEEMFGWDEGRAWRAVQRLYVAGNSEGRASTS